jgi:two-component system response regulator DevR
MDKETGSGALPGHVQVMVDSPPTPAPLRVLLVDGHRLFRAGLRKLLADYPDLAIVDDVGTAGEALERLARDDLQVIVTEVQLPDISGIEFLRRIRAAANHVHVLFLTTVDDAETLLAAAEAGAAGYVLKDISPENLVNAIRAVHEGRTMIHPVLARKMLEQLEAKAKGGPQTRLHGLTDTEISIIRNVALGLSDREIAARLHLSEATVKKHLRKIYSKLGARNRAQAALLAVQHRLLQ